MEHCGLGLENLKIEFLKMIVLYFGYFSTLWLTGFTVRI